jgi:hypothetical protein
MDYKKAQNNVTQEASATTEQNAPKQEYAMTIANANQETETDAVPLALLTSAKITEETSANKTNTAQAQSKIPQTATGAVQ